MVCRVKPPADNPPPQPQRRRNALTGDWVLVSPQRDQRPWQGAREAPPLPPAAAHDPECYLCPGNARAGGATNPAYTGVYVFDNDFPALLPDHLPAAADADSLFVADHVTGRCRVICYSPEHNRALADLSDAERREVIDVWCAQSAELGQQYRWVQIFENRGTAMGCSNHHPHGQIWASEQLPTLPEREDREQARYHRTHARALLLDYAERELERGTRVVCANTRWLAVVPWWATWPFETLLLPRSPVARLAELGEPDRAQLATLLGELLSAYDRLFGVPFPYSFGWHGAPGADPAAHWQLHAHILPPLLRSATVRKFMVGYEMLAEAQRDMTPEAAAERLRAVVHS